MSGKLSLRLNNFIQSHKELSIYLFFALLSVFVLFFYSQDSYLYDLYNRVDSAWFFMCGKAWMNGMVPYVDFTDSKGPLLWLIYGLGYLISPRDYTGVYWITCVWYSFTYYFTYKLADIFLKNKRKSILCAILMTIAFFNPLFHVETRAEDFCLLFVTISLYRMSLSLYDDEHQDDRSNSLTFFIFGCCFAALFLIKFNYGLIQCVFPLWMALYLIKLKRSILRPCICWLGGVLLTIFPFLIYFLIHDNLWAFINEYIINTIYTIVGNNNNMPSIAKIPSKRVLLLMFCTILFNLLLSIKLERAKLGLFFCSLCFFVFNLIMGRIYYFNINSIFLISGVVFIFKQVTKLRIKIPLLLLISALVILPVTVHIYYTTYDGFHKPFKFKMTCEANDFNEMNAIMGEIDKPLIINVFSHEYGYGIESESLPACKYWANQNGATDRMIEEHLKSIMSCRADYLYIKSLSLLDKYDLSLEQLNCIGYVVCCENRNGLLLRKKQHS